jgi:hypothetical protein
MSVSKGDVMAKAKVRVLPFPEGDQGMLQEVRKNKEVFAKSILQK